MLWGAVTSKLFCNRANCHVKLEKWEEAAADATEAITRDDKYSKAFALRGQARMSLENYEDAAKDYNQASQLAPESTEFKKTHKEVPRLSPLLGHVLFSSVARRLRAWGLRQAVAVAGAAPREAAGQPLVLRRAGHPALGHLLADQERLPQVRAGVAPGQALRQGR